ncbi:DoxX family protein [Kribbella deserti]|uniref:DoxX family protein n=1 Tax=Kribbella deserti TaxID=1926257 RepID=A0ABV6QMC9_9ACTN
MNTTLWIVAGVLATVYVLSGSLKIILPKEKIAKTSETAAAWTEDFSPGSIKAIGVFELLGGLGLILPAVFDIAPVLIPLAAVGLALIMVGAALTRFRRHEYKLMALDLIYFALICFVAWGRFGPESFTA